MSYSKYMSVVKYISVLPLWATVDKPFKATPKYLKQSNIV